MIDFIAGAAFIVIFVLVLYGIFREAADEQVRWEARKQKREDKNNVD
jgi:hypothetical protein